MSVQVTEPKLVLGKRSAGMLLTPEEFDAVSDYDENYIYELINGVLVVREYPAAEDAAANDLLGHALLNYQDTDTGRVAFDLTLPLHCMRSASGRRLANRAIWAGFGRIAGLRHEVPSFAVDFVSEGKRDWDYRAIRQEYLAIGVREYWIIDRFRRTMTVVENHPDGPRERVIAENEPYQSPLLPGFDVPLARLLAAADRIADMD